MDEATWTAFQVAISAATRRVCRSPYYADLQHDAWVACLDALPRYDPTRSALAAFLYVVASRTVWRRLAWYCRTLPDDARTMLPQPAAAPHPEKHAAVQEAWHTLPPLHQWAWQARHYDGIAVPHIAQRMRRCPRTIRRWCAHVDHALADAWSITP